MIQKKIIQKFFSNFLLKNRNKREKAGLDGGNTASRAKEKKTTSIYGEKRRKQTLIAEISYFYFKYSNIVSNVQLNNKQIVQTKQQSYKNLDRFNIKLKNGCQLHFQRPVREVEGWLKRTIRFAESQRSNIRVQIISKKRQITAKCIQLNICLQNVRGISSKLKQDQMMRDIEEKHPDFIGLVETRLQRLIGVNNNNIAQTQLARNGGVLVLNNGKYPMKTIKKMRQYIAWTILNVGGFPVYFSQFIPLPTVMMNSKNSKQIIIQDKIVETKCHKQRIIVMGDFNFFMKEIGKRLQKQGLIQSVPVGVETHTKGNQLDQVYMNVETISWETSQLKSTDINQFKLNQSSSSMKMTQNYQTKRRRQEFKTSGRNAGKHLWMKEGNQHQLIKIKQLRIVSKKD
ncbi:hypothetical protein OXYTRIMIC_005 [Oxytricha trifallax]|uniref:Endonuclease/exonuclease/phosphatase domain-containing protein n=1 Tax=Oxytricha trifallax TaxID=1172189 RepID=A0A073HY41_9SPIT|nr:hypothetical protein OXYTRIMIC_005 [Oxytricha trifallax]